MTIEPHHIVMLKILLPIKLVTTMSPRPSRATIPPHHVWDGCSGSQDSQAHNHCWDAEGLADL